MEMGLDSLLYLVIILVVVGIVSVVGLQIMEDTQDSLTSGSAAYNASSDAIEGVAEIPSKLPMIATAVVGIIIIGLLLTYLYFKQ